jgi:flagella basal body P-ring formation protein FlgA
VAVQTRVFGPQVVAKRYLAQGTRLKADDLEVVSTDITRTPADLARSIEEVQGKVLGQPLAQGANLVLNILREPSVIKVGEGVRVQIQGKGFQASGEGVAMSAGAIGDSIRVRMPDGQQVSGRVARAGVVEVVID